MQIEVFAVLVWLIGVTCLFVHFRWAVIFMFAFMTFGGAAAVSLPSLGGATITPANCFLPFYLLRALTARNGPSLMAAELGPRRPLFLFLLLTLWAAVSGFLLPRLFEGSLMVFSLNRQDDSTHPVPLHPTSGNLSQAVYALGGFALAWITCAFCRQKGGYAALFMALLAVSVLDIISAVLDIGTYLTGTGYVLDVVRTGAYTFLTEGEIGGAKRIAGFMTEASIFAAFSLQLFAVNFALFISSIRPWYTGPIALLLALLILGSTSSAGYVGLVGVMAVFGLYAVLAAGARHDVRPVVILVLIVTASILSGLVIALVSPSLAATLTTVISETILNKAASDSAIERGSWNSQALEIFFGSHGLGAGIGSTRVSNYALVLLSNLGALGFVLFAALFLRAILMSVSADKSQPERTFILACRAGIAIGLFVNLFIGTIYDLGSSFYCFLGICLSAGPASLISSSFVKSPSAAARRSPNTAGLMAAGSRYHLKETSCQP